VRVIFDEQGCDETHVLASQVPLHQVILNLVTNSLKFTKVGEVRITTRFVCHNNTVEFEVKDSGIGMSQHFIEYGLFEPFKQEEKPLIGSQRGVGLGMAISKQMLEKMNGNLRVTSAKGRGTTSIVTLRSVTLTDSQAEDVMAVAPVVNNYRPAINKNCRVTALIVDDNNTNRKVMFHLLQHIGFQCLTANSGEEALEIIKEQLTGELDVIFMDIFMPGMGGIKASKKINELTKGWRVVPIIIGCTADTTEKTFKECIDNGITRFVHKPIDKKELKELHQDIMERKSR